VSTVTAVTLTRRRHPFEGRSLQVLGSMRRHGAAELLVVLPDGSKRLIPAAWTDLEQPAGGDDAAATLGSVWDLLRASVLVSGLSARVADSREQAARKSPCKEDNRAACAAQSDAGSAPGATPYPDGPASRAAGGSGDVAAGLPDRQGSRRSGSRSGDGGLR
jgi:Family of unknown function (DUF5372)